LLNITYGGNFKKLGFGYSFDTIPVNQYTSLKQWAIRPIYLFGTSMKTPLVPQGKINLLE
jgi:hypothetical protein